MSLEAHDEGIGVIIFYLVFGREHSRRVSIERKAAQYLLYVARTVAITEVDGVAVVELIVAFDRVLILAVLCDLVGTKSSAAVVDDNGSQHGPIGAGHVELREVEVATIDLESLHAKRVRDSQLICRQVGDAEIAERLRPLGVADDVVLTECQCVGRIVSRRQPGDAGVEVSARESFQKVDVRGRAAINDAARDV